MSQAESRLSRGIMAEMRREGAFVFKVHGSALMMAGLPDIIGVYRGRFVSVESKRDTELSERQTYVHGLIREAGGFITVAHTVTEALHMLADVRTRNRSIRPRTTT